MGKSQYPSHGTADVDEREHAGADHGEDGHGLGEAADGVAPGLLEEQQNGGDQGAGVADTDPPDEVDDGEAPGHRLRDGPDANALEEEPGNRNEQHRCARARDAEDGQPAQRRVRGEHDARDLFGYRLEGLTLPDDSEFSGCGIDARIAFFDFAGRHRDFNPFPARVPPGAVQVQDSGSELRRDSGCADACSGRRAPGTCACPG